MKKLIITMISAMMIIIMSGCKVGNTTKEESLTPAPAIKEESLTPAPVTEEESLTPIPATEEITTTEELNESQESKLQLQPGFDAWEETEAVKALNQVLTMGATVKVVNAEEGMTGTTTFEENYLDEIKHFIVYDFEESLIPDNYAIVDMDRDNTPEVIVNLSSGNDGWIIVLRYYEGSVYGYPFVYRGLKDPKLDGTYMASSGAFDNSILEMSFHGLELNEKILGYSMLIDDSVEYHIADEKVSEEDYVVFSEQFFDKEDVSWHQFVSNSGL